MTSPRITALFLAVLVFAASVSWSATPAKPARERLFTPIRDILANPGAFTGSFVTVQGEFRGWQGGQGAPPVTRSDWVVSGEDGATLYCTGVFPDQLRPDSPQALGKAITILGRVAVTDDGRPFLQAEDVTLLPEPVEKMVSVAQILFDPIGMQGKRVGLHGVLAKGYGPRGNRLYLLADPTGAITLDRLPKLFPKGTILQIKGTVGADENGLPKLTAVEILAANP